MNTRPTAEERRQDYLRIGAEIVQEYRFDPSDSPMAALANVKVAEVAERAQVTKGALYHIWKSQEDYRRDLLQHLLRMDAQQGMEDTASLMRELGPDFGATDVLRVSADFAFDRLKDDPAFFARFSFYLYTEEVRDLLAGTDAVDDRFRPFIDYYLGAVHRRLREPFTTQTVFACVSAFIHGLVLRHRTSADLVERSVEYEGASWRMYAFGTRAIIDYFSEPDDDAPEA